MKPNAAGLEEAEAATAGEAGERRGSHRAITVYRVVRVEHAGNEGLARCRNLSGSGARLDVAMPLALNDRVDIAFSPSMSLSARVVWIDGQDCGVAFDNEIDSAALLARPGTGAPPRALRSPRLHADLPATVRCGSLTIKSHVSNISQRGMKLSHDGSFHAGLQIKVVLAGGREKTAVVRWAKDNVAGVYLLEPFSVEELGSAEAL